MGSEDKTEKSKNKSKKFHKKIISLRARGGGMTLTLTIK